VSARGVAMSAAPRSLAGSTPTSLKRLMVMVLAGTVLLWLTATILQRGLESTAESVRGSASPTYLDAVQARAALSDADRAAWLSFSSGAAQLTGPGPQYQTDLTNASQALQRLAALEPPGGSSSMRLQTISAQLVTYQGLVEQADAANRADVALGAGSKRQLGLAYLTYAYSALGDHQGGLLAGIDQLAGPDQQALRDQLASPWADPVLLVAFAVPALLALAAIAAAQAFLRRRFRRAVSLPLLLAALLACGLSAWMVIATLHADAAFAAAKTTALPQVTRLWQDQIKKADRADAALQENFGSVPRTASASPDTTDAQRAGRTLDADLAAAESTDGLPIAVPLLVVAIAALGYFGLWRRLNEYRG
jgi:hypothetical protein